MNFVDWYNNNHRHSGIKFLTPNQHQSEGLGHNILKRSDIVYKTAKLKNLGRRSKETRNLSLENEVWLNPEKSTKESTESSNVS